MQNIDPAKAFEMFLSECPFREDMIVSFCSRMCPPCNIMDNYIKNIANDKDFFYCKIPRDDYPRLFEAMNIKSVPVFFGFSALCPEKNFCVMGSSDFSREMINNFLCAKNEDCPVPKNEGCCFV